MKSLITKSIILGLFVFSNLAVQAQVSSSNKDMVDLIKRLSAFEDSKDIAQIPKLFSLEASYHGEQGSPFFGRSNVEDLYRMLFERFNLQTEFKPISIEETESGLFSNGKYSFMVSDLNDQIVEQDTIWFHCWAEYFEGKLQITKLQIGLEKPAPISYMRLPKPSGKYLVGTTKMSFKIDKARKIDGGNQVPCQIWYPANPKPTIKVQNLITKEAQSAVTHILGWPEAIVAFIPYIQTNTYPNSTIANEGSAFPVIFYNHGYSGHSGVYQSIFEELASQGYIVVSVGHPGESAYYTDSDGRVVGNNPASEILRLREEETIGQQQEAVKDRIFTGTDPVEQLKYYKELLELSPYHQKSVDQWVFDCEVVLKNLKLLNTTDPAWKGKMDLDNIGSIGHSVGGAVAGELAKILPEVKAGINLDGFQFGSLATNPLKKPFMFMAGIRSPSSDLHTLHSCFFHQSKAPAYLVGFLGWEHACFTNLPLLPGFVNSVPDYAAGLRIILLQREVITQFFDLYLAHSKEINLLEWSEENEEVRMEYNNK